MNFFEWNDEFKLGINEVDEQHHILVDITNDLGTLLSHDNVKKESLEEVFDKLVDYTQYHFHEEENMMVETGIDHRHIEEHVMIHKTFLKDVLDFKKEFDENEDITSKNLFDFLTNWLVYHILGSDMGMSRQVSAIKNGLSAEEAYEIETKREERSTTMLLTSLNNLFKQISNKNKRLKELNQNLELKVQERTKKLSTANKRLHELATTDTLTGLSNRREAMDVLAHFWPKEEPLSCIMIDADNFKQINDTYGHDAGDTVLIELSKTLQHAIRTDDVVCRLGGDEFFIICEKTDEDGILKLATNVHKRVNELNVKAGEGIWKGSISVGIATRNNSMKDINELIKQADLAVYASKEAGKNCVKRV